MNLVCIVERLLGDVAGRFEGWVGEEGTRRVLEGREEVAWRVVLE